MLQPTASATAPPALLNAAGVLEAVEVVVFVMSMRAFKLKQFHTSTSTNEPLNGHDGAETNSIIQVGNISSPTLF